MSNVPAEPQGRENRAAGRFVWLPGLVRLLVLTAAVLLGLGLVAPCMTLITTFGRYDGWLRLIAPEILAEGKTTYSLLGGILTLIDHGDVAIGMLLLAFSCVFPTLKLTVMAWATERLARGGLSGWLMRLGHHAGKFSMLDVMVLALLVIAIKGLPGRSELRLEWGIYAFAASVILSLFASLLLGRMERLIERRDKQHEPHAD